MAKTHEITRPSNSLKLSADKIVMLPVSEVRPYEKNPRKNADAVKFVKASIEQLGRKCFMMEMDPHYCDVIIARWEKLTGQKAVKLEG